MAGSCVFVLLLLPGFSALSFDVEGAREYPVTKVVNLLKDMQTQLEKEAEEDEEIYDKMACWCETNDKEKTKAIADAEKRITDLGSAIEAGAAAQARLSVEIDSLKEDIAKDTKALETATALREKEAAEFSDEEKEALEAIKALDAAIVVLSKHHPEPKDASAASLVSIAAMVQKQLVKHADILGEVITPSQKKLLKAFAQAPASFVQQEPEGSSSAPDNSYKPRSGQIFGILKQMKETFEANLSDSQKEELAKQEAFEGLKAAKEEEIALGKEELKKKTVEAAETKMKLANDKDDLEDTRNGLSYDQKFLMDLKVTCQMSDQDWEARQKSRTEEIAAVSKAIGVLTTDEARSLFNKTFNPTLLQIMARSSSGAAKQQRKHRADEAAALLRRAAGLTGHMGQNLQGLAKLVIRAGVGLDSFVRVKKAIDDMVAELLQEKQDEIKKRDWCIEEGNTNIRETDAKLHERDSLAAKISDLEVTIKGLTDSMASLKSEIAELQEQMKKAGEDRSAENEAFQETLADQRATQKLLQEALSALKSVYKKPGAASLAQKKAGQPVAGTSFQRGFQGGPPPGFQDAPNAKHDGGVGVLMMIEQIITDAKNLEKAAIKDEEKAQAAYEDLVNATNASIGEKEKDIANKSEQKAKAEADKATAEIGHEEALTELEELGNEKVDLGKSCDFLLRNFEVRQAARDQEVDALRGAKAILSGAKMDGFLQRD